MKLSMITILRETAENDITNIKEGKRIYRKIVNNIASVNYAPTDKNDFVISTTGKKYQLHGIKFNLNQIEKKYDLNLLFVHVLGSNNLCHYNKENNRMVFFIISQVSNPDDVEHNKYLTWIRFKSWIEEDSFIHEFVHFLDIKRFSPTYIQKPPTNEYNYFNSPEEYNTYYHELLRNIIKNKKNLLQLNFKQFLKQSLKLGRQDFISTLNDDYKQKLQNRLYKLYDHMKNNVINENKNIIIENTYKVYHGTNEKFDRFNFKKATQGIVWFTDNIDVIKNQEHGGMGNKFIMTRYITLNNPAGWDEYDKYGLQQLQDRGYDGAILPSDRDTTYFVFSPKSIHTKPPHII